MKKHKIKPTRSKFTILRQICNFIPQHTVSKIAKDTGAQDMSRTITPWSHVVSQCYAQLTHSIGLNDVSDSLQLHSGPLASIRGATPPSRNGFSNANRERPAEMAEELFWAVISHLQEQSPGFVAGKRQYARRGQLRRLSSFADFRFDRGKKIERVTSQQLTIAA